MGTPGPRSTTASRVGADHFVEEDRGLWRRTAPPSKVQIMAPAQTPMTDGCFANLFGMGQVPYTVAVGERADIGRRPCTAISSRPWISSTRRRGCSTIAALRRGCSVLVSWRGRGWKGSGVASWTRSGWPGLSAGSSEASSNYGAHGGAVHDTLYNILKVLRVAMPKAKVFLYCPSKAG
jgi:hypothetical protein